MRTGEQHSCARCLLGNGVHPLAAANALRALFYAHGLRPVDLEAVGDNFHIDHKLPLARGGINHPDNLCVSCPTCNFSKGMQTSGEFGRFDIITGGRVFG